MRILLVGKSSGRLDCLADAIQRSKFTELFILTNLINAGLIEKGFVTIGPTDDPIFVAHFAETFRDGTTIAVISNEEPLATGVVDTLEAIGIPVVGPTKALAQIETSKSFTRRLLVEHGLTHMNPNWGVFEPGEINRVESFMHGFGKFVIKPDGLSGGKGVRVLDEHFHSIPEGLDYCNELFNIGSRLLIEQKQEGQEFSLMSFSDGNILVDMPAVQDHKRLLDGDMGPMTGGMGSYSDVDHSLPILSTLDFHNARQINRQVIHALQKEIGVPYRGIIYGNYMITRTGLKLIEFNARFGDPEVMNVLPLLETDFADILFAITHGTLKHESIKFATKATVCKYVVPIGHPGESIRGRIDLSQVEQSPTVRLYRGALDGDWMTGSRAAAIVGIAETIDMAERYAEKAVKQIVGRSFHRKDIGTAGLIRARVAQMDRIRKSG